MKTLHSLRFVFAGILIALLGACAMYPHSGQKALAGSWANSKGTVWNIHADGTFDVDLNHDGKRDAWGKYTVSGDTITILEASPKVPKAGKQPAVYHFTRSPDVLHFTLVKDAFKMRRQEVLLDWHKK